MIAMIKIPTLNKQYSDKNERMNSEIGKKTVTMTMKSNAGTVVACLEPLFTGKTYDII